MEEISTKEKEMRALVQVTSVLYERSNELQTRVEEQYAQLEALTLEHQAQASKDQALNVSVNFAHAFVGRTRSPPAAYPDA